MNFYFQSFILFQGLIRSKIIFFLEFFLLFLFNVHLRKPLTFGFSLFSEIIFELSGNDKSMVCPLFIESLAFSWYKLQYIYLYYCFVCKQHTRFVSEFHIRHKYQVVHSMNGPYFSCIIPCKREESNFPSSKSN